MTEPEKALQPSTKDEAKGSSPLARGAAVERAEDQLAAGNQDSSERSHEALTVLEGGSAEQMSNRPNGSDAVTRRRTGDEHDDDHELDEALDDKALVDGVAAANETAQIVQALTPHNL
jgi:hypothetical protein